MDFDNALSICIDSSATVESSSTGVLKMAYHMDVKNDTRKLTKIHKTIKVPRSLDWGCLESVLSAIYFTIKVND